MYLTEDAIDSVKKTQYIIVVFILTIQNAIKK